MEVWLGASRMGDLLFLLLQSGRCMKQQTAHVKQYLPVPFVGVFMRRSSRGAPMEWRMACERCVS